jgi:hypothetical protein
MSALKKLFGFSLAIAIGCGGSTANDTGNGNGNDDSGSSNNDATTRDDSGNVGDSTPPSDSPSGLTIDCGLGVTCDAATQICCATTQGATCTAPNACQGFALVCSSAQSCPNNDVCCVAFSQQGGSAKCQAAPCPQGPGHFQLCAHDSECPNGERCRMGIGGLHVCGPSFDGGPGFDGGGPKDSGSNG